VIVLDASAAIELLLGTDAGARVRELIAPDDVTLHAPHLIDLEVAQARRLAAPSGT
jgi:predicted nucleic acid-binding protein